MAGGFGNKPNANNKPCSSPSQARAAALRLLDRRRYTEKELRGKLREKGAGGEVINEVAAELIANGLIDDEKYCEAFIHYRKIANVKGRAHIRQELLEKGVDASLVASAIEAYYSEDEERAILCDMMGKEIARLAEAGPLGQKKRDALIRKYGNRGFKLGLIFEILAELGSGIDYAQL